jgi:hypothetical protein
MACGRTVVAGVDAGIEMVSIHTYGMPQRAAAFRKASLSSMRIARLIGE